MEKVNKVMVTEKESHSMERLPQESSSIKKDCIRRSDEDTLTNERCEKSHSFTQLKAFLALFYLILSVVSNQSMSVIVKKLSYISICQLSLIRCAGMPAAALPLAVYLNKQIVGDQKDMFLIILRGFMSALGIFCQIVAYRNLQIVEASIVIATYPFATAVTARFLLKERLGIVQSIALVITLCGVFLSLRLPEAIANNTFSYFDVSYLIGLLFAILAVFCLVTVTIINRKLKTVHFSIMLLYTGIIGMIANASLSGIAFPLVPVECGWDQITCMLLGIFGVTNVCFFILATQIELAGIAALQKSSLEILITAVFQILFLSVYPDVHAISGACLVLVSLIITGMQKWVLYMPETSNRRKKFKWILL